MDKEVECVCCHEIQEIVEKNRDVFEKDNLDHDITCITDNPGFKAVSESVGFGGCLVPVSTAIWQQML